MEKKKFNIIYNGDKEKYFGRGYYVVYQNYKGEATFDTFYPSWEHNEQVDAVSVGVINKIRHLYELGYVLDIYYSVNLEDLF